MIATRPKPYKFQLIDIRRMEAMNLRSLLSWDMGLGKTVATLACLYRNPHAMPAVVVCPASVKFHWEAEAAKFGIRTSVAEGRRPPILAWTRGGRSNGLLVINYDILPFWTDVLKKMDFKTIILDECQNLGNQNSSRTKASVELARPMKHAIALSGTPLTNRPAELWPTLNILRPDLFGSFWNYASKYCKPRFYRGEWHYNGAEHLSELNRELKAVMIRRRKGEVLKDLPEKTRHIIPVKIRRPEEYREAANDFLRWMAKTNRGKLRSAARAEKMVRVGYLLRLTAKLKMKAVVEWANTFLDATDEKLVLFSVHKKAVNVLKKRCLAKSVVVDGSVTGRDRVAVVEQFRRDKNTRLLVGNIKAAGTGIDGMQMACRTCGFVELWWVPASHVQAEDRLHRIGQTRPVSANYFVAVGTIEEKLCQVIQTKQSVIGETLDGDAKSDLNVFDELMKAIMKQGERK